MTKSNLATREWMRKNDLYDKDMEEILQQMNINYPEQDFKTFSQNDWDELYRLATVERFKELKDQQSRNRLQKKCDKLEKEWRRISKNKKTVGSKKTGTKTKPSRSQEESDNLLKQGRDLKKFMQKNEIWEKALFEELVLVGVTCEKDIVKVDTQNKFDEIIRKTKVQRVQELKDQQSRNRLEKKLTSFEKIWRQKTGIKKTVQTKKSTKTKNKKKAPKEKEISKIQGSSNLKQWMQKQSIWEKDLFDELVRMNVNSEKDIVKLDTQEKFDEIVRKVRVQRFTELKDKQARNRLDKKLTTFEKIWRQKTGIKKTMTKIKN